MNNQIIENKDVMDVFFRIENGGFKKVDMKIPLQMLFDDLVSFVSITEN